MSDMAAPALAVLGATGFIGSNVVDAAVKLDGWNVRPVWRGSPGGFDVRDAASVSAAVRNARAVVHAASYIGNDPTMCEDVNVSGTANVVAACTDAGVSRLVYVSTAAVYGRGPFNNAAEDELPVNPTSTLSRSRADAEQLVLDAGGVVVRPHLVLGVGDRWVGPGIVRLARTLVGLPRYVQDARHSVIDVAVLGQVITDLAIAERLDRQVFHAANRMPLSVREIADVVLNADVLLPVGASNAVDPRAIDGDPTTAHALALLGADHVFDTAGLDQVVSVNLSESSAATAGARNWYRVRSAAEGSGPG